MRMGIDFEILIVWDETKWRISAVEQALCSEVSVQIMIKTVPRFFLGCAKFFEAISFFGKLVEGVFSAMSYPRDW